MFVHPRGISISFTIFSVVRSNTSTAGGMSTISSESHRCRRESAYSRSGFAGLSSISRVRTLTSPDPRRNVRTTFFPARSNCSICCCQSVTT